MYTAVSRLEAFVWSHCDSSFITHSRVHLLRETFPGAEVWVKREDESGFGISGTKLRKYASLLPFLLKQRYQGAALTGSSNSGNIAGLAQLLISAGIEPTAFLKQNHQPGKGIYEQLIRILLDPGKIHLIPADEWKQVQDIAQAFAEKSKSEGKPVAVIPEGAFMKEALPGACSLALSLLSNESELQEPFDHLFMDAGTGFSAGAMAEALQLLSHSAVLHVILLTGSENSFSEGRSRIRTWMQEYGFETSENELQVRLYTPVQGKSFGSIPQSALEEVRRLARTEGILSDPVYSAKLFLESRRIIREQQLKGKVLIIHSGGAPALLGFSESFT